MCCFLFLFSFVLLIGYLRVGFFFFWGGGGWLVGFFCLLKGCIWGACVLFLKQGILFAFKDFL